MLNYQYVFEVSCDVVKHKLEDFTYLKTFLGGFNVVQNITYIYFLYNKLSLDDTYHIVQNFS